MFSTLSLEKKRNRRASLTFNEAYRYHPDSNDYTLWDLSKNSYQSLTTQEKKWWETILVAIKNKERYKSSRFWKIIDNASRKSPRWRWIKEIDLYKACKDFSRTFLHGENQENYWKKYVNKVLEIEKLPENKKRNRKIKYLKMYELLVLVQVVLLKYLLIDFCKKTLKPKLNIDTTESRSSTSTQKCFI